MPAKGSKLKCGERTPLLSRKLHRRFRRETKIDIDYKTFQLIIEQTGEFIQNWVITNPLGFKLPKNLGYITVCKYKPKKKMVNYITSGIYGKSLPLLNLHTHGYQFDIKWYKEGITDFGRARIYYFEPERKFNRALGQHILKGFIDYNSYTKDYFKNNVKVRKRIL